MIESSNQHEYLDADWTTCFEFVGKKNCALFKIKKL